MTDPARPAGVEVDEQVVLTRSVRGHPYRSASEVTARRTLTIRHASGTPRDWQVVFLLGYLAFFVLMIAAQSVRLLGVLGIAVLLGTTVLAAVVNQLPRTPHRLIASDAGISPGRFLSGRIPATAIRRLRVARRPPCWEVRAETAHGAPALAITPTQEQADYIRYRLETFLGRL